MLRFTGIFIIAMLFLTVIGCGLVSNEVKNSFRTVNESIKTSSRVLGNSTDTLYSLIKSQRALNPAIAAKADSMYDAAGAAIVFIDSLKDVMKNADTTLESLDVADTLLVNTPAGEKLTQELQAVFARAYASVTDSIFIKRLDDIFKSTMDVQTNRKWTEKYFHTTPIVAALTILSKFHNDCINATSVVLNDIACRLVPCKAGVPEGK